MIAQLQQTEKVLIGNWIFENGKNVEDSVSKRIQYLINDVLKKVSSSDDGWDVLYIDMEDSRYWELIYPDSHLHGGGAPLLKNISHDEAVKKYNV